MSKGIAKRLALALLAVVIFIAAMPIVVALAIKLWSHIG